MSYSVQLYSVRESLEQDLPGTIKRIAELGFTQVEPYDFVARAPELAVAMRENGITAPSAHGPLLGGDRDRLFTSARALGISTVIVPLTPAEQWTTAEDIKGIAAGLNAAAIKGAAYGVRVGYHNHAWELETAVEGETGLEYLARHLDPRVVLEVDTYWAAVGGQDPVRLLERLGDRVKFIHIKDGPLTKETWTQLPAGQGKVPVRDVIWAAGSLEVGVVEFDDYGGIFSTA